MSMCGCLCVHEWERERVREINRWKVGERVDGGSLCINVHTLHCGPEWQQRESASWMYITAAREQQMFTCCGHACRIPVKQSMSCLNTSTDARFSEENVTPPPKKKALPIHAKMCSVSTFCSVVLCACTCVCMHTHSCGLVRAGKFWCVSVRPGSVCSVRF